MPKQKTVKANSAAELLKLSRETLGLDTIYAASKKGGASTGTLHRIEHGAQDPSISCLAEIIESLGGKLRLVAVYRTPRRKAQE